ncbi:het domain containing protein [Apiospora saccharicola]
MAGNARLEWDRVAQFLGPLPPSDAFHRQFGSHGNLVRRDLSTLMIQLKRIHDQRTLTQKGASQELFDVLARWSGSASTDPRDKIYGVLGLAPRELRLPVDYSKTLPAVHLDAVRAIIDYSANLDIIAQNPWRQDKEESIPRREPHREQLLQLPSWVPTFSVPLRAADQRRRLLFAQRGIFNAGPSTCQVPCHIANDGALRTRGVVLDTVGQEIPGQGRERGRPRNPLPHISMHSCAGRDLLDESCPTYVSGESAFTAYWRTLATDRTGFPMSRLQSEQIATLDRTLRERMKESMSRHAILSEPNTGSASTLVPGIPPLSRAEDGGTRVNAFSQGASPHLFDNTICDAVWRFTHTDWGFNVTARGLYAMLLRGSAQQGDTIACLEGAKVPLVLRGRVADGPSTGALPRFEVIGPAYVHGFMDGEAFDSVELRGRLQLKTEGIFLL